MSKFNNDDIKIPDYRIELWTSDGSFVADISSLAVSNIVLQREKNLTDYLHLSVDYDQLLNRLRHEGRTEVLKPFLTEVRLKRNFELIFAGFISLIQLNLSRNKKRHLEIEVKGFGDYLEKRLISGTYADMSYPDMARQIISDTKHELNWISNYAFEYEDNWFRGWTTERGTVTKAVVKHWNGGIVMSGAHANPNHDLTRISTTALMATPAIGKSQQYLCFDMWYRVAEDPSMYNLMYTREEVEQYEPAGPKKDAWLRLFDRYGSPLALCQIEMYLQFTDSNGNVTTTPMKRIEFLGKQDTWMHLKDNLGYEEFYKNITLGNIKGNCTKLIIDNTSVRLGISDLMLHRDIAPGIDTGTEANVEETTMYNHPLTIGHWDSELDSYSNDRIRHYHRQNAKEAIHNLAKLQDQNFEYNIDSNKRVNFYKYEGSKNATLVLNYPGIIEDISIKRSIDQVFNVNYGVCESSSQGGTAKTWCSGASSRDSIRFYKFPMVSTHDYENVNSNSDIYNASLSDIQSYDEVQTVPEITLNSNKVNPSNIHIGDAVTLQVEGGELFDFINGTYRVYSYTLRVTPDTVEEMTITLIEPTSVQLQEMTFPRYLKMMDNDIQRLQFKRAT